MANGKWDLKFGWHFRAHNFLDGGTGSKVLMALSGTFFWMEERALKFVWHFRAHLFVNSNIPNQEPVCKLHLTFAPH